MPPTHSWCEYVCVCLILLFLLPLTGILPITENFMLGPSVHVMLDYGYELLFGSADTVCDEKHTVIQGAN